MNDYDDDDMLSFIRELTNRAQDRRMDRYVNEIIINDYYIPRKEDDISNLYSTTNVFDVDAKR
jgi:hypothetical protein